MSAETTTETPATTRVEVRSNSGSNRCRAGFWFSPTWSAPFDVTAAQLAALKADKVLEVREEGEASPEKLAEVRDELTDARATIARLEGELADARAEIEALNELLGEQPAAPAKG